MSRNETGIKKLRIKNNLEWDAHAKSATNRANFVQGRLKKTFTYWTE